LYSNKYSGERITFPPSFLSDDPFIDHTPLKCSIKFKFPVYYIIRVPEVYSNSVYFVEQPFNLNYVRQYLRKHNISVSDSIKETTLVISMKTRTLISRPFPYLPHDVPAYVYTKNNFNICNRTHFSTLFDILIVVSIIFLCEIVLFNTIGKMTRIGSIVTIINIRGFIFSPIWNLSYKLIYRHIQALKENITSSLDPNSETNDLQRYRVCPTINDHYLVVSDNEEGYDGDVFTPYLVVGTKVECDLVVDEIIAKCEYKKTENEKGQIEITFPIHEDECVLVMKPNKNSNIPFGKHTHQSFFLLQLFYDLFQDLLIISPDSSNIKEILELVYNRMNLKGISLYYLEDSELNSPYFVYDSGETQMAMDRFASMVSCQPTQISDQFFGQTKVMGRVYNVLSSKVIFVVAYDRSRMMIFNQETVFVHNLSFIIVFHYLSVSKRKQSLLRYLIHDANINKNAKYYEVIDQQIVFSAGNLFDIEFSMREICQYYQRPREHFLNGNKYGIGYSGIYCSGKHRWVLSLYQEDFDYVMDKKVSSMIFIDTNKVFEDEIYVKDRMHSQIAIALLFKMDLFGYDHTMYDLYLQCSNGHPFNTLLSDIIHCDDFRYLTAKEISNRSIIRFKNINEEYVSYIFLSGNQKKFNAGFLLPINQFNDIRANIDPNSDYFEFFSKSSDFVFCCIDPLDFSVFHCVANRDIINDLRLSKRPRIHQLFHRIHSDDIPKFNEAWKSMMNSINYISEITVRFKFQKDYEYSIITLSTTRQSIFLLQILNIDKYHKIKETYTELNQLVDTALCYSNVIIWTFQDTHHPELILTTQPVVHRPYETNWTTIQHNVASENQEELTNQIKSALEHGTRVEMEIVTMFEKTRTYIIRGLKTNKPGQLAGILVDTSDLKLLTEQAEEQMKKAEEANSAKSRYLANMSHEIRTPLNGMSGLIELLQDSEIAMKNEEIMKCIRSSFNRLINLLNDTLDHAKFDQNKMPHQNICFNIYDTLINAIYPFEQRCLDNSVELRAEVMPGTPAEYIGEPHFLSRITANLLSNSIKNSEKGRITARFSSLNGEGLVITIVDNGNPVKDYEIPFLFEMFPPNTIVNTNSHRAEGTCLALVKRMVDTLGGSITIKSRPESVRGVEYYVYLPFEPALCTYVHCKLKEKRMEVLVLCNDVLDEGTAEDHSSFVGLNLLFDEKQVTKNLLIIVIANEIEQIKIALRLKKQYPECNIFLITRMKRPLIDGDFIVVNLSEFWLRFCNFFLRIALHKAIKKQISDVPDGFCILVADDTQMNQIVISKLLDKMKISHIVVNNGQEAVDTFLSGKYHFGLILMDIQMPIMDGIHATRIIRERNKNIPIYGITANIMKDEQEECLNIGMNGIIIRPISQQNLKKTVQEVLSKSFCSDK